METAALLNKWRHLIEPEISSGLTPVPWEQVLAMPVRVVEGEGSVLVLVDAQIAGRDVRSIWVAAGAMAEVLQLMDKAEDLARKDGIGAMAYVGRRGWARAAGYNELAVIGLKELQWEAS